MIGDVCTQIYQRSDQSIIKIDPDLAACAIAGICIEPADPDKHAAPMAGAKSTDQLENIKRLMHQNLALQQRIDTLGSSVETVIQAPKVPQPNECQKAKDHTKAANPVMPSPQGQTAKKILA